MSAHDPDDVAPQPWSPVDDVAVFAGATICGRCELRANGGHLAFGLIVHRTDEGFFAVWWDRYAQPPRFRAHGLVGAALEKLL